MSVFAGDEIAEQMKVVVELFQVERRFVRRQLTDREALVTNQLTLIAWSVVVGGPFSGNIAVTPLAGLGDRGAGPFRLTVLGPVFELRPQSPLEQIDRLPHAVPGAMGPDQLAVDVERHLGDRRSVASRVGRLRQLHPREQDGLGDLLGHRAEPQHRIANRVLVHIATGDDLHLERSTGDRDRDGGRCPGSRSDPLLGQLTMGYPAADLEVRQLDADLLPADGDHAVFTADLVLLDAEQRTGLQIALQVRPARNRAAFGMQPSVRGVQQHRPVQIF